MTRQWLCEDTGPVLPVHDGASLAGNDSSEASWTRSAGRRGRAARSEWRRTRRSSLPVAAHHARQPAPVTSNQPGNDRRLNPITRSAPAPNASNQRSVSHSFQPAGRFQTFGSLRCCTRLSVIDNLLPHNRCNRCALRSLPGSIRTLGEATGTDVFHYRRLSSKLHLRRRKIVGRKGWQKLQSSKFFLS